VQTSTNETGMVLLRCENRCPTTLVLDHSDDIDASRR
jgi:hypothetical protein